MGWSSVILDKGPVPMWFQIANLLRDAISAGEFGAGDKLPSEGELNKVFGISRTTARAALDKLENEGLIIRQSGRGSIVLGDKVDQPASILAGFADDMRRRNLTPSYQALQARFGSPPRDVMQAFDLDVEIPVFMSRRLLLADGKPIGVSLSWIAPDALGDRVPPTLDYLGSGSLYAWLVENCGVSFSGGREFIEAASLDRATAAELGVDPGTAALVARRLTRDQQQRPVEYAVNSYRADRYRYWVDLDVK